MTYDCVCACTTVSPNGFTLEILFNFCANLTLLLLREKRKKISVRWQREKTVIINHNYVPQVCL